MDENNSEPKYVEGSFNWYLFMSGKFVTTMARAIQQADTDNKERLRRAFPQMCAAHECRSWDMVPDGFEPVYNGDAMCDECNGCVKLGTTICGNDTEGFSCYEGSEI